MYEQKPLNESRNVGSGEELNTHPNKQAAVSCCLCQTKLTHFCDGAALFQGGTCRRQLPAKHTRTCTQTNAHTHRRDESRLSLPSVHPALSVCHSTLLSWRGEIRCSVFRSASCHGAAERNLHLSLHICYVAPGRELGFFFYCKILMTWMCVKRNGRQWKHCTKVLEFLWLKVLTLQFLLLWWDITVLQGAAFKRGWSHSRVSKYSRFRLFPPGPVSQRRHVNEGELVFLKAYNELESDVLTLVKDQGESCNKETSALSSSLQYPFLLPHTQL